MDLELEENEIDSDINTSSSDESDNHSDDDLLGFCIAAARARRAPTGRLIPRVNNYIESTVLKYSSEEFP